MPVLQMERHSNNNKGLSKYNDSEAAAVCVNIDSPGVHRIDQ